MTQLQERDQLIQLNLRAGQKAKLATADAAAIEYLNAGITLLPIEGWHNQYAHDSQASPQSQRISPRDQHHHRRW